MQWRDASLQACSRAIDGWAVGIVANQRSVVKTSKGEMQVGGLIASVGQRMISGIAKMMINHFFKKMQKELKS